MFGGEKGSDLLPFILGRVANGQTIDPDHEEPLVSLAADHLIKVFLEISRWRTSGGFGPSPLSLYDITSYCSLNGFMLNSFELECIKVLDSTFLSNFKTGS